MSLKRCVIFIVLLLPVCVAFVAVQENNKAVHAPIIQVFDGLAENNVSKVLEHCTADVTILENGVIWNVDSIRKNMASMPKDLKRINTFEFIDTRITTDAAWVSYKNQADFTINGKKRMVRWLESAFLIKDQGRWKIQLLHSTVVEKKTIQ